MRQLRTPDALPTLLKWLARRGFLRDEDTSNEASSYCPVEALTVPGMQRGALEADGRSYSQCEANGRRRRRRDCRCRGKARASDARFFRWLGRGSPSCSRARVQLGGLGTTLPRQA